MPPTVNTSTVMPVVASLTVVVLAMSLANLMFWLDLLTARLPCTETKPYTLMSKNPLACSNSPLAPSMVSVKLLLGPVLTVRSVLPSA